MFQQKFTYLQYCSYLFVLTNFISFSFIFRIIHSENSFFKFSARNKRARRRKKTKHKSNNGASSRSVGRAAKLACVQAKSTQIPSVSDCLFVVWFAVNVYERIVSIESACFTQPWMR